MNKAGRKRAAQKAWATRKAREQLTKGVNGDPAVAKVKLASEFEHRNVEWLFYPWIPRSLLSMVVGNPCVGKSTSIAGLLAHATGGRTLDHEIKATSGRAVMLPGYEEDLEVMTVPRLKAAGVQLDRVKMVTEDRLSLVRDKERLAKIVLGFNARLLVGDPIDSYIDEEFSENDGQAVRPLLEAAAWIARTTGAAVCCARHPGKDKDNVMPGSRAWRAVPRSILQLTTDGNIPPRYLLSHYKDSLGTQSTARAYTLNARPGEPPRIELCGDADAAAEDLARSAQGPTGRYKLMLACRLVRWAFSEDEPPTRVKLGEEGRKQGLGEDTVNEALRLLGVRSVPPERRGDPWKLVQTQGEWPQWLPDESVPF